MILTNRDILATQIHKETKSACFFYIKNISSFFLLFFYFFKEIFCIFCVFNTNKISRDLWNLYFL